MVCGVWCVVLCVVWRAVGGVRSLLCGVACGVWCVVRCGVVWRVVVWYAGVYVLWGVVGCCGVL